MQKSHGVCATWHCNNSLLTAGPSSQLCLYPQPSKTPAPVIPTSTRPCLQPRLPDPPGPTALTRFCPKPNAIQPSFLRHAVGGINSQVIRIFQQTQLQKLGIYTQKRSWTLTRYKNSKTRRPKTFIKLSQGNGESFMTTYLTMNS